MPKIFEYFGLVFYIYTNDHLPIHVHVKHGELESKIEFIYENAELVDLKLKKVRGRSSLSIKHIKDAMAFCNKYNEAIKDCWLDIMVFNKPVKAKKITKKI